ncbi:tripartite tricarboxylate transporter substrate binding protein [soil metagenome]
MHAIVLTGPRPRPGFFVALRLAPAALSLAAAFALLQPCAALAQAPYPARAVRLVVSYAPGNVTDLLARIVASKLASQWGQGVVVDNRAGQGGSLGAQMVAKAPADGYTLLFSAMAALAINPHVYANVGYDPLKDFVPVINVASPSLVMVVSPSLNVHTLKDLVAYSKAHPSGLNYGTAGNGTAPHLNMEALKQQTGLVAQHVPYKAAAAVTTDLLGGRVQIQQDALSVLLPQVAAGRLTPILAGNTRRLPQMPEVQSMTEAVPGFVPVMPWLGIFAPAGTPAAIVLKINQDVNAILKQPDVLDTLASNGLTAAGDSPDAFGKLLAADHERLGKLVRQLAIKVD